MVTLVAVNVHVLDYSLNVDYVSVHFTFVAYVLFLHHHCIWATIIHTGIGYIFVGCLLVLEDVKFKWPTKKRIACQQRSCVTKLVEELEEN